MKIHVHDNNIKRAYKKLHKMLQEEGVIAELTERRHYTKPSEAKRRAKNAAIRRNQKRLRERTD